jgi:Kef-type K+ transport system membrane component KefB
MPKHLRHFIKNQPQVKVIAHSHDNSKDTVWFVTLAAAFAGVFYFFGYYFWHTVWRVLMGG